MSGEHESTHLGNGRTHEEIIQTLKQRKEHDRDWRNGRVFGLIYHAGKDVEQLRTAAHELFAAENAVSPGVSPSLVELQNDLVEMTAALFHGDRDVVGHVTTGGTESNMLAVLSARNWASEHRPAIDQPEVVFPETAHPTIAKAAHCFDVRPVQVPVRDDWRADVNAMADAITENTVLVVGSAPSITIGVVDPIFEIGMLAQSEDIKFHVDACIGGFVLPFLGNLGYSVPEFDFSVPGVTSIAADHHKFGYGHKGASTILYRDEDLRRYQYFAYNDYPGGLYTTPTLTGSKSGGPIAAAWAVMQYLGTPGYEELVGAKMRATEAYIAGINSIDGLQTIGDPDANMFAFGSVDDDIDPFTVYHELSKRGWVVSPMKDWQIHLTITYTETTVVDEFLVDLETAVQIAKTSPASPDEGIQIGYGVLTDDHELDRAIDAMSSLYIPD